MPDIEVHQGATALVGQIWERTEELCEAPLAGLWALLDRPPREWRGSVLPPLAHWLFFLPRTPQALLGADGHPAVDEITPPAHLPRRMWGGGALEFLGPLTVGDRVTRRSTVTRAEHKTGRSGELMVVTLEHRLSTSAGLALLERQDIVYRAAAAATAPMPPAVTMPLAADVVVANPPPAAPAAAAAPDRVGRRWLRADPSLLFRFSALTFNAHRIHYDRDYCRQVEGYPDLVVHGPLIAMLMLDHAAGSVASREAPVRRFEFRNHSPLFEGREFAIETVVDEGPTSVSVAAIDSDGRRAASGVVSFAAGTS